MRRREYLDYIDPMKRESLRHLIEESWSHHLVVLEFTGDESEVIESEGGERMVNRDIYPRTLFARENEIYFMDSLYKREETTEFRAAIDHELYDDRYVFLCTREGEEREITTGRYLLEYLHLFHDSCFSDMGKA